VEGEEVGVLQPEPPLYPVGITPKNPPWAGRCNG
jgi:hypothetical protein